MRSGNRQRPGSQGRSLRAAKALAAALLLPVGFGIPQVQAQSHGEESRTRESEEQEALRDWARRQYEALERGSGEAGSMDPTTRAMERLWALYFLAVDEGDWEDPALSLADSLARSGASTDPVELAALSGALEVVRAKHSRWPPNKLKFLNRGLAVLDNLIQETPRDPVARYLRLVSTFYLPFFLDRDETAQEDLTVLSEILPDRADAFSPPVYRAVLDFVLAHADTSAEARSRLEGALAASRSGVEGGRGGARSGGPPS